MSLAALHAAPGVTVPASALRWRAVRSSGPGGQNVNKVASKVELRVELVAIHGLTEKTGARLRYLAGSRLTLDGELVVTSALTRDQGRNLDDALAKLQRLLEQAQALPKPRRATRPSYGSVQRRLGEKKHTAARKQGRKVDDREG